ncbi:MAG: fused MFS/spermidine synthase [Bacteroidales bacterium]
MSRKTLKIKPLTLLIIAFVEGAAVMAAELLSAKMLAPFFGTTIYAWAAVLAITLLALATGYYTGGFLTTRFNPVKILIYILLASGFLLLLMPAFSTFVMKALVNVNLIPGLIISLMLFVFPPVLFFGMVSPVIIHTLVHHVDQAGSTAGRVYAISTLGGVLNTLLLGFYIMPQFGIRGPAMVYGILILLMPLLLIRRPARPLPVILVAISAFLIFGFQVGKGKDESQRFKILYASEGILGQVKVVDIHGLVLNGKPMEPRGLIVNNTWQTLYNRTDQQNLLDYIYFIKPILSEFELPGKNSLLVGLGGGMLAREMQKTGMHVEAVEIDGRLKGIARRYFGLDPEIDVIIDDGRHFLNQTPKQYSLVVMDAFLGENAPWHLLTRECFATVHSKLEKDGLLIIEFFGHIRGDMGRPARSVLATLEDAGFRVQIIGTRKDDAPDRNLIFIASKGEFPLTNLRYEELPYAFEPITDLNDYLITVSENEMKDALVMKDNLPSLELMLGKPSLKWRNDLNAVLRNVLLEDEFPIFY